MKIGESLIEVDRRMVYEKVLDEYEFGNVLRIRRFHAKMSPLLL
jgi:hypothetical protein